jgi:hypothetical protein
MSNAGAHSSVDAVQAALALGMLALVIVAATAVVVRRWRGADTGDRATWSPHQIAADRRWRLALGVLLMAGWIVMAVTLVDGALRPGAVATLPKAIGPLPLPQWLAFALAYRGLWYLLWGTGTWFGASLDRRNGAPRPFRPVYGFICFLILASLIANAASLHG